MRLTTTGFITFSIHPYGIHLPNTSVLHPELGKVLYDSKQLEKICDKIWNSVILSHFGHFDFGVANSHSEKVVFWGRGRIVLHIFHPKKVFKNEKCFYFLKVWKLSFPTVPVRASNSQWSPRTVKHKNKLWISKLAPFEFRHLRLFVLTGWVTSLGWEFEGYRLWNSHFNFVFDRSRKPLGARSSHRYR